MAHVFESKHLLSEEQLQTYTTQFKSVLFTTSALQYHNEIGEGN